MKKILALSALGCLLGAFSAQAQKDIYITGSTAFRTSAFFAVSNLYSTFTAKNSGTGTFDPAASRWTTLGQISSLFGSQTVTIHANFNGSVQGIHALYDVTDKGIYYKNSTLADTVLTTNTATLAFTDVDSASTAYPLAAASFIERQVAIQPFVYVRSLNCPSTVTNITIQQLQQFMPAGVVKLSYLTGNTNDASKNCYLLNRSLDSGTRVTAYADASVSGSPTIYYWRTNGAISSYVLATNNFGPALYGYGYVGGGDIKAQLNAGGTFNSNNIAIAYLGLSDARGVNGGANILTYSGVLPSSDMVVGGGTVPATPAYDYSRNGQYSYWAYEVLAQPKTPGGDNTINATDILSFTRKLAGYDTSNPENFVGGAGSIDFDVSTLTTKNAIRLGDMNVNRTSVGGPIAP